MLHQRFYTYLYVVCDASLVLLSIYILYLQYNIRLLVWKRVLLIDKHRWSFFGFLPSNSPVFIHSHFILTASSALQRPLWRQGLQSRGGLDARFGCWLPGVESAHVTAIISGKVNQANRGQSLRKIAEYMGEQPEDIRQENREVVSL